MKKKILSLFIGTLLITTSIFATTWYTWRYRDHATDCTAITDGKLHDLCYEDDTDTLYRCDTDDGICDTAGEWKLIINLDDIDTVSDRGATTDQTLTAAGFTTTGTVTANTITDGTLSITGGDISGAGTLTAATLTDGTVIITNGTLSGGSLFLEENSFKLDDTLSGDAKWSGITVAGVSGVTTLAVGDLCYLNADDSRWELVDANLSDGYDKQLGICVLAGADGAATEMLIYGKVRASTFPSFTVGSPLYISETAGDCTHTAPTTTDSATRVIGIAITAEDLLFNPSNDYLTNT